MHRLRKLEPKDTEFFYKAKNNPEVSSWLGGFNSGYSKRQIEEWIDFNSAGKSDLVYAIVDEADEAVGQVGLYKIDHRIRSAEFAIMVGVPELWGTGLGTLITHLVLAHGFKNLNLNRIYLELLETNERAMKLYEKVGFKFEGRRRQAQFKHGRYLDVIEMGLLANEYLGTRL